MLPLGLLNAAQGHPMLVELKNGETLNGHLVLCDTWMNLTLREVVQTSPEGDKFMRLPEVYVKGNNIKYLRVPDEIIDIASTSTVYEKLRHLRSSPGNGGLMRLLVKYLVKERGESPNVFLYEALVVANWDTTEGSAGELAAILKEMKTAGMERSPGFYHSALKLLAIHPDYLLRTTLLREMSEAGVELSADGKGSVVLGLLRDGQNEMALEYWDQLHQEGTKIPTWVSETFIYVLAMRGFAGEAFQAFRKALDKQRDDTRSEYLSLWYYLLDECSRAFEYEGTNFIWKKMVAPGTINPSDGMILNVLNTAARHGDPTLATAALELLSKKDVTLRAHHYEPLIESYVEAGDMENTFRVLCIMADSVMNVGRSSTRSIFLSLKRSPALVDEAVRVLNSLSKEHNVPVIAVKVVLEALLSAGAGFPRTFGVYQQVCEICKSGPGAATMLMLLEACDNAESAVLLVQEMDRFSIPPSPELVDHLIRCFAHDGSLDVALLYFDEMCGLASSPGVSQRTADKVLGRCVAEKDPKAFKVAEEVVRRGRTVRPDVLAGLGQMKKELAQVQVATPPPSGSAGEEV
ncbi:hypothetical protein C8A05DRAFT_29851 [Staphylotrichum tortipilum]|uniref:Sm domain-containing protein n=1 Tax=Staphylotrichum tortipilum TaxID=2831512 RepID=A0AAN6MSF1_9PEZI|nr:hypothetical protein C8A05DRAFT_29851 [Staphylotrichum longicolle]